MTWERIDAAYSESPSMSQKTLSAMRWAHIIDRIGLVQFPLSQDRGPDVKSPRFFGAG